MIPEFLINFILIFMAGLAAGGFLESRHFRKRLEVLTKHCDDMLKTDPDEALLYRLARAEASRLVVLDPSPTSVEGQKLMALAAWLITTEKERFPNIGEVH